MRSLILSPWQRRVKSEVCSVGRPRRSKRSKMCISGTVSAFWVTSRKFGNRRPTALDDDLA